MYDPSKRLYLGNLPQGTTKKDLSDFIRRRTRANPSHMEIGTKEGADSCFAHCSVEGLKSVIEALNDVPMNNQRVVAAAAKPHYMAALIEAKKERERKEREAEAEKEKLEAELKEKMEKELEANGGKVKLNPPKSFYARRQTYATIASEIARKCREAHQRRLQYGGAGGGDYSYDAGNSGPQWSGEQDTEAAATGGSRGAGEWAAAAGGRGRGRGRGGEGFTPRAGGKERQEGEAEGAPFGKKPRKEGGATPSTKEEKKQEPPKPAEPVITKEEKKLSALQQRLLALKSKVPGGSAAAATTSAPAS